MKEPDLEENALTARVEGNRLQIARQSLQPNDRPARVTGPDGVPRDVTLTPESCGRRLATLPIQESGLYRITNCTHTALAAAGPPTPTETSDGRPPDAK